MLTSARYNMSNCMYQILEVRKIYIMLMSTNISLPSWKLLEDVVTRSRNKLLICSPWLSRYGLLKLQQYFERLYPEIVLVRFWTRLADPNTDSDLLLTMVQQLLDKGIRVQVKDSPNLHAKIYLADRHIAVITSANLSQAGFEANLEIASVITEPSLLDQTIHVVEAIDQQLQEVSLEDLRYFVQNQRPIILATYQVEQVQTNVVPIWRQHPSTGTTPDDVEIHEEMRKGKGTTKSQLIHILPDNSSHKDESIDILAVVENDKTLLDQYREEISEYTLEAFKGKKIRITVYPCDNNSALFRVMRAGGQSPFQSFDGFFEDLTEPQEVGESFTHPVRTGQKQAAWLFRPLRARRKKLIVANFPMVHNPLDGTEQYYLFKVEIA